jgi:hypothetical protein
MVEFFVFVGCSVLVYVFMRLARKTTPALRELPALKAIDEIVGRCTEMNRPLMYNIGIITAGQPGNIAPQQVAGMGGLTYVARQVAEKGARIVAPTDTPVLVPTLQEIIRNAYASVGKEELYNDRMVTYVPSQGLTISMGISGLLAREKCAGSIWIGNAFTSIILVAETGYRTGAIQVMGTDSITNVPTLIAACDYVLIGEEMYAAGAILSEDPVQLGSIVGQDVAKLILLVLLVIGVALATANVDWFAKAMRL